MVSPRRDEDTVTCVFHGEDCRGRLQWHHCVPQQRIKREFPHGAYRVMLGGEQTWDTWRPTPRGGITSPAGAPVSLISRTKILRDKRNRAWVCAFHHGQVEAKRLYVDPPESVREFARDYGLEWSLESDARKAEAA